MSLRIWTPSSDLDPTTKLSENIILIVLVEIDNTLRSSAHESMFLIQNMRIANAYELTAGNDRQMFLLTKGKCASI